MRLKRGEVKIEDGKGRLNGLMEGPSLVAISVVAKLILTLTPPLPK